MLGTYKPGDNEDSCQSCPYGKSTPHVGAKYVDQCSVGKYLQWKIVDMWWDFTKVLLDNKFNEL